MPDFGTAGSVTVRKRKGAVDVRFADGEYLHFEVTVGGPIASFVFVCQDGPINTSAQFAGHPKSVYQWDKRAADVHQDNDEHIFRMFFNTNIKYTYVVEHRKANDSVVAVVKDLDFESTDGQDNFPESLTVTRIGPSPPQGVVPKKSRALKPKKPETSRVKKAEDAKSKKSEAPKRAGSKKAENAESDNDGGESA